MKVREALAAAASRLAPVSDTARLDAELLMAHVLGTDRPNLLLAGLDHATPAGFEALLERRLDHEPVAYLVGHRDFWTIDLEVGPGALVPRPDSETLIEAALAIFGPEGPATILDLGTGPGTLLFAALDQWPGARGLGVDRSTEALAYAHRNAARLGLADRCRLRHGDWAAAGAECFDLILCNPPYVETGAQLAPQVERWEPHEALFAGRDGLDAYRMLASLVAPLLTAGGAACIEIGAGQRAAVGKLFADSDLRLSWRNDLAGRTRCMIARLGVG